MRVVHLPVPRRKLLREQMQQKLTESRRSSFIYFFWMWFFHPFQNFGHWWLRRGYDYAFTTRNQSTTRPNTIYTFSEIFFLRSSFLGTFQVPGSARVAKVSEKRKQCLDAESKSEKRKAMRQPCRGNWRLGRKRQGRLEEFDKSDIKFCGGAARTWGEGLKNMLILVIENRRKIPSDSKMVSSLSPSNW